MGIATRIPGGEIASVTDNGPRRSNEDREWAYSFPGEYDLPIRAILAVADGAGGGEAGEVASQMAIQRLQQRVNQFVYTEVATQIQGMTRNQVGEALCDLLDELFGRLHDEIQRTGDRKSATTLTVVFLCDGFFVFGHVGDSRLYLATRRGLRQLSVDQKSGPAGAVRALGSARIDPQIEVVPLEADGLVILCSDGVSDVLDDAALQGVLGQASSTSSAATRMIARARDAGTRDNCTVAVGLQGDYRAACPPAPPSVPVEGAGATTARVRRSRTARKPGRAGDASRRRRIAVPLLVVALLLCAAGIGWILLDAGSRGEQEPEAPLETASPSAAAPSEAAPVAGQGPSSPEQGTDGEEAASGDGAAPLELWRQSRKQEQEERARARQAAAERAARERREQEQRDREAREARRAAIERRRSEEEARALELEKRRQEQERAERFERQADKVSEALDRGNLAAAEFLLEALGSDFPERDLSALAGRLRKAREELEQRELVERRTARKRMIPFSIRLEDTRKRPAPGCFDLDSHVVFDPPEAGSYLVMMTVGEGEGQRVMWGVETEVEPDEVGETRDVRILDDPGLLSSWSRVPSVAGVVRDLDRSTWKHLLDDRLVTLYVVTGAEYEALGAPHEEGLLVGVPEGRSTLAILPSLRLGFQAEPTDPCPMEGIGEPRVDGRRAGIEEGTP